MSQPEPFPKIGDDRQRQPRPRAALRRRLRARPTTPWAGTLPRRAGRELGSDLKARCDAPGLFIVYATEALAASDLIDGLRSLHPDVPITGGTTCRGVLTETGVHVGPSVAAVLALEDEAGSFGAGTATVGNDPAAAAADALEQALDAADRSFEVPSLIWICPPPGTEEKVLAGLASVVGPKCPIIGGSSADETIAGRWRQFATGGAYEDHVSVAVLFPADPFGLAFQSGYAPSGARVRVETCSDRRIRTFESGPAASVYAEELAELETIPADGNILAASTARPLGRHLGDVEGFAEYLLLHPAHIDEDASLSLFANVATGDELVAMRGDLQSLVDRAELVASSALELADISPKDAAGGLVIYCGGCMLAIPDRLHDIAEGLRRAFRGAPFLTAFTFGEQGATLTAGNQHGNLMVAAAAFRDG